MSEAPKPTPLCEALLKAARGMRLEPSEAATRADIAYLDGHNAALAEMEAEISKRFAALSVEDVARVIQETDGGVSELALAVMRLLRKE